MLRNNRQRATAAAAVPAAAAPIPAAAPQAASASKPPQKKKTTLQLLIQLARPKFLVYSAMLLTLGSLLALVPEHSQSQLMHHVGGNASAVQFATATNMSEPSWSASVPMAAGFAPFSFMTYLAALAVVVLQHIATHYVNEYYDYEADVANKNFSDYSGGSRVLADGHLPKWMALYGGVVISIMSLLIPFVGPLLDLGIHFSAPLQVLIVFQLLWAWQYTAPPLRLHYNTFGEATVALLVTCCVVVLGFLSQLPEHLGASALQRLVGQPGIIILFLVLQSYVRMMVMNMPDEDSDRFVNKITTVVRFGLPATIKAYWVVQCFMACMMLSAGLLDMLQLPFVVAYCVTAPTGFFVAMRLREIPALMAKGKFDWGAHPRFAALPLYASVHVESTTVALLAASVYSILM